MLLRDLACYIPLNVAKLAAGFGGVYLFSRLMEPSAFGTYILIIAGMGILDSITFAWIDTAAYRFQARAERQGRDNIHIWTLFALITLALIPNMIIILSVMMMVGHDPDIRMAIGLLLILMPFNAYLQSWLEISKAKGKAGLNSALSTIRVGGGFLIGVGFALIGYFGPADPILGMTIVIALLGVITLFQLGRKAERNPEFLKDARTYFYYGAPYGLALALEVAIFSADRFMLAWFIDKETAGAFGASQAIAAHIILIMCAWIAMAAAPAILRAHEAGDIKLRKEKALILIRLLLLLCVPAAFGISALANPIGEFMIGESLRYSAQLVIPYVAFAGLLQGLLNFYFAESYTLSKRSLERAALLAIPLVLNLVCNAVLIPMIGLQGAVISTCLTYVVAIALFILAGRRFVAMPFPLKDFVKIVAASLVMWAFLMQTSSLLSQWPVFLEIMFQTIFGVAIYSVLVISLDAGGARQTVTELYKKLHGRFFQPA